MTKPRRKKRAPPPCDEHLVRAMAEEISRLFEEFDANCEESLQSLATITSLILCNGFNSRQDSDVAREIFITVMASAIHEADELGMTAWGQTKMVH